VTNVLVPSRQHSDGLIKRIIQRTREEPPSLWTIAGFTSASAGAFWLYTASGITAAIQIGQLIDNAQNINATSKLITVQPDGGLLIGIPSNMRAGLNVQTGDYMFSLQPDGNIVLRRRDLTPDEGADVLYSLAESSQSITPFLNKNEGVQCWSQPFVKPYDACKSN
jgi:hypothetical protein